MDGNRRTIYALKTILYGFYLGFYMGGFRKVGVPYFGVLIIRILLFRVLY